MTAPSKQPARSCGCGKGIRADNKSGRCRSCSAKFLNSNPEQKANRVAGLRAVQQTPAYKAALSKGRSKAQRRRYQDPDQRAELLRQLAAARRKLAAQPVTGETRALRSAAGRRKWLSDLLTWCPSERVAEYRRYKERGFRAHEARAMILDDIAAAERRRLAAMTPFERQLERVRNGATVSTKAVMPVREHGFTLGGVASGAL